MLKKIYVGFALFLFLFSLFIGIDRFAHRGTSRFSFDKIASQQPYSAEWEMPPLTEVEKDELNAILSQTFTYYSKGSQAYVFISEDKRYILKFLKQVKLCPNSWLAYLPLSFNPYYQQRLVKEAKCRATFAACKTAVTQLKEETGVLYVHLNRSRDLNQKVTLFDRSGNRHSVDVNKTCFYVQKRAQLIYARISELMYHKNLEQAKAVISSVFSLIEFLGRKGVVDNDPILRKNFGLIEDMAVQIDIGKMRIDPDRQKNFAYKEEVQSITHSFKKWLQENYPELVAHFDAEVDKISS